VAPVAHQRLHLALRLRIRGRGGDRSISWPRTLVTPRALEYWELPSRVGAGSSPRPLNRYDPIRPEVAFQRDGSVAVPLIVRCG
jgi:hypothetical protein